MVEEPFTNIEDGNKLIIIKLAVFFFLFVGGKQKSHSQIDGGKKRKREEKIIIQSCFFSRFEKERNNCKTKRVQCEEGT